VLPSEVKNSDPNVNSYDRFFARAPVQFLDEFYTQGGYLDRMGGLSYDWFQLQDDAMEGVEVALNPLLIGQTVDEKLRDVIFGTIDDVTGGVLPGNEINAAVNQIMGLLPQEELQQLTQGANLFAYNADQLHRKVIAFRKNLILLSECTMRNLAQAGATVNVIDHCATAETLGRIDMNGVDDFTGLFRDEMEGLFTGAELDPAPVRSRSFNINRLASYFRASFKLADILEVITTIGLSDALTLMRQFLENNRDEINQAFFVVLPTLENLMIAADSAVCSTNCLVNDCVPQLEECIDGSDKSQGSCRIP
jgi:hypothetical protein